MSMKTKSSPQAGGVVTEAADDFKRALTESFRPRNDRVKAEVDSAVDTLVGMALADQSILQDDVLDTVQAMISSLDKKLTDQINEVLHAPEFQQIESAWRGLHYLVFNSETDSTLKIRFLNISKDELVKTLKSHPGAAWDQSPIFKQIYGAEYDQLGGEPYGCLVGDYYFNQGFSDVQLLQDLSKVAAAAHAPFISAAEPTLLGMNSWIELNNPRDLGKHFDTPDYAKWRSLRDSDDASYLGLCMPRVLARVPYGAKSEPVEEFAFEEDTDGHTGEKYAWMNAAYAMATNINRAFKEYGWCTRIRGVESGGEVLNLPTHTFPTDEGGVDLKCPTEIAIGGRRESELSKAGLLPLIHRKNTDKAAFIGAQSVYKPKKYAGREGKEATASSNLRSRLPYMFAVSRIAHYLKVMIQDKIGSTKTLEQLERWLQDWVNEYVDGDPNNSDENTKARRPLAGADIKLTEDLENPGVYYARFLLKPHYQLEAMDVGLSLTSKLPEKK